MFSVSRVDDRVIHGQVVTAWAHVYPCDAIIIVDDDIAQDPVLKTVYKNAAIGKKCYIFTVEQAYTKGKEAANSASPYFLIAKNPITYEQLHKSGVNFGDKLILGPMSGGRDGRRLVAQSTSMNEQEAAACNYLSDNGVEVVFQTIPDKPAIPWSKVRSKF